MSRGILCPGLAQPEGHLSEMSIKCHMCKRRPANFSSRKGYRYRTCEYGFSLSLSLSLSVCVCVRERERERERENVCVHV